jgi:predicted nuclease of predicted toxin-antitoxin system
MRFLIDENLSPRLVPALSDIFPGSTHVETLQLRGCDDARVWAVARDGGYMVLTRDDDFNARSVLYGAPPKVVHLRVGNVATETIVALLRERQPVVEAFARDEVTSLLVLP